LVLVVVSVVVVVVGLAWPAAAARTFLPSRMRLSGSSEPRRRN
jgi:hypothetical protein